MKTYGYIADSNLCLIYNRDPADNFAIFETTKLDVYESNKLANAIDKLCKQAFEQGRMELAENVRRALPQPAEPK